MKNYDLMWVRDHLGLSQEAMAALCSVSRATYNAWECGRRQIPKLKFNRLLYRNHILQKDIPPPPLEYREDGFPVGWDSDKFDSMEDEDTALEALEGPQFEVRTRKRYELLQYRILAGKNCEENVKKAMEQYDAVRGLA